MYKSRLRTEPTNVTAPQWISALWSSLESMIEEIADCCIKVPHSLMVGNPKTHGFEYDQVYTLEKVLTLKKDSVSQVLFLDEAMKVSGVRIHREQKFTDHFRFWKISQVPRSGRH